MDQRECFVSCKFFNLDDVFKIPCYFLTATIDPSFIFRAEEESSNSTEANIDSTQMDVFCTWKPSHLSTKYVNHSCNKKVQKEIFQHITNCVSKQNWEKCDITTSDYLDVQMTNDYKTLLKPTAVDVLLGFITYDVKGVEQ